MICNSTDCTELMQWSVADPGLPRGVANSQRGVQTYSLQFFAENCIKMKEFEPGTTDGH